MRHKFGWLALVVLAAPPPAFGQGLETLGNRAASMTAFVAVADDASAVAWNPAGLVLGPFFNISVDLGRSETAPDGPLEAPGAARVTTTLLAIGVPPLGLSYYRMGFTTLAPTGSAVEGDPRRETVQVGVRTLVTTHLGATVLQSLGDHLTVGTTVKLVRGRIGGGTAPLGSWDEGFDQAETLDTEGSTTGDLDIGVMFTAGRVRAGAVVRNLTEPTFGGERGPDGAFTVGRHARVGLAWGDRWPGAATTLVALDADVTRVESAAGDRRDVAAGVERWFGMRRLAVRGGVRASTVGDARPVTSAGLSYAVRSGAYVDAYLARGTRGVSAWGIAGRLSY